jgi:voltage-gated potassium channel
MASAQCDSSELRPGAWEAVMLFLSLFVLGMLAVEVLVPLRPQTKVILQAADTIICVVFIGDFAARLARARDKRHFLKWNWIDLLASVPNVEWLRTGRLVRVFRALRAFRSARLVVGYLFRRRASGTLATAAAVAFVVWFFSSVAILAVETDREANIRTASDALWWSFTTITTVGYGDKYPVSAEGRLIAAVLMIAGVGLFGTFTAAIASAFVTSEEKDGDLKQIRAEIAEIRAKLDRALRLDSLDESGVERESGGGTRDTPRDPPPASASP